MCFQVLNLFLALLLNAFTADNIEDSKTDEESKMVKSIKNLINMCRKKPVSQVSRQVPGKTDILHIMAFSAYVNIMTGEIEAHVPDGNVIVSTYFLLTCKVS